MNSSKEKSLQSERLTKHIVDDISQRVGDTVSPYKIFKNYKPKVGTRFTADGFKQAIMLYQAYIIDLDKGKRYDHNPTVLIALDQTLTWPYYIDAKRLVVFNQHDAFIFGLYGGDLLAWAKAQNS